MKERKVSELARIEEVKDLLKKCICKLNFLRDIELEKRGML